MNSGHRQPPDSRFTIATVLMHWQASTKNTISETPASDCLKVVMCSTAEGIGPQDGIANEGCLLYMPGDDFYRPTQREAIKHWNAFATALTALRVANGQLSLAGAGTKQGLQP